MSSLDRDVITTLPFEVLDIIKDKEPGINPQHLALTCRQLYHWRCHYTATHSTPASRYVQGLLENSSATMMRQSLSFFKDQLPTKQPIDLAYTKRTLSPPFLIKQPLTSEKLDILKIHFPRVETVHCSPEFKSVHNSLQAAATVITTVAFAAIWLAVGLASLPFLAIHRIALICLDLFSDWRLLWRVRALDPLPFITKVLATISAVKNKILVHLGKRAKDENLELLASHFPDIKKLEMAVAGFCDYFYGVWGTPPLPDFPQLETLKITSSDTLLKQRLDFSQYATVTTLHLDGAIRYAGDDEPTIKIRLPPRCTSLTLHDGTWLPMPIVEALLARNPQIQSLSLLADHISERITSNAGQNVRKLYIECELAPLIETTLPYFSNLETLSISQKNNPGHKAGIRRIIRAIPPNSLVHLALKRKTPISDQTITEIFTKFSSLQTLTYCLPQDIQLPASHPNLNLEKLTAAEMDTYFQSEHHLLS